MASDTVPQIKDRLSIVDVVSGHVKLTRAGTIMKARCPFHAEKTASFIVSPDRGTYHCFGCGVHGDIFTFVQEIEGLDFKGALKVLADRAGVTIESHGRPHEKDDKDKLFAVMETAAIFYASSLDDEARKYLIERGLQENTIREFRLGFASNAWSDAADHLKHKGFSENVIIEVGLAKKNERGGLLDKFRNRIMFPIADSAGRIVAFSGRSFGEHASPEAPKYLNSPETPLFHKSRILYGFDKAKQAIRKLNCAVLVEGQMDLLASHQAGWTNTIAVSGTAFTPEHALLVKRMTENLVLALDADEAGIKAAGRAARAALAAGINVKVARLPSGLDPADLIQKKGREAWSASIREASDIIDFLLHVLAEKLPQQDRFRRSVELIVLPFVQDVQSPIAREHYLHVIAGRLGVSETAVSEALARMPQSPEQKISETRENDQSDALHGLARAKLVLAIILWQESLKQPALDTVHARTEFKSAIGEEAYLLLESSSENEKEALRFSAERIYGTERSPESDMQSLLTTLLRERLSKELVLMTSRLKRAEAAGDSALADALLEQSRLLTAKIAQLHVQM